MQPQEAWKLGHPYRLKSVAISSRTRPFYLKDEMIARLIQTYQRNWMMIRTEINRIGAEVEQWSYDSLAQPAEKQSVIECLVGERAGYCQVDCYDTHPNGDLAVCIDFHGGPPTLFGIKPSYCFFKRRDGSVYY